METGKSEYDELWGSFPDEWQYDEDAQPQVDRDIRENKRNIEYLKHQKQRLENQLNDLEEVAADAEE